MGVVNERVSWDLCSKLPSDGYISYYNSHLGPVAPRLMTSQLKDIVTHTQKLKTVKCIFCGVWVQNFVRNFNGALWNFTQNFEPYTAKYALYEVLKTWRLMISSSYDILSLSETSAWLLRLLTYLESVDTSHSYAFGCCRAVQPKVVVGVLIRVCSLLLAGAVDGVF